MHVACTWRGARVRLLDLRRRTIAKLKKNDAASTMTDTRM